MPARYLGIKKSYRKKHPKASEEIVEMHAARIYNSSLQPGEKAVGGHSDKHKKRRKK